MDTAYMRYISGPITGIYDIRDTDMVVQLMSSMVPTVVELMLDRAGSESSAAFSAELLYIIENSLSVWISRDFDSVSIGF